MNNKFDKLREIAKFAAEHSEFYRDLYHSKSIDVDSFSSIDELPIIYPRDLLNNPFGFKASGVDIYKICLSSGTVSSPKVIFRTIDDYEHSVSNEVVLLEWAGITSSDIMCIPQTFGTNGYGDLTLSACEKLKVPALPIGEVSDTLLIKCIYDFGVTVLDICPSKFAVISETIDWRKTRVRLALMSGETIPAIVARNACLNGIQIINQYGSTEFDALAGQKIGSNRLTLLDDDFIFEIVDDKLVVSSLYHHGTPLIRYCLGDKSVIEGSSIDIKGRENSVLLFDGIKIHDEQLQCVISSRSPLWQCLIYTNRKSVSLEILLMPSEDNPGLDVQIRNEIINSVDVFKSEQVGDVLVNCCYTTQFFPSDSRKFRRYVDLRIYSARNLLALINMGRYDLFFKCLPSVLNSKLVNEIYEMIPSVAFCNRFSCAKFLIRLWSLKSRKIGDYMLLSCLNENRQFVIDDIITVSNSDSWETREDAAKLMAVFLLSDYSRNILVISKYIHSESENTRRAAMLALKYACLEINDNIKLGMMLDLLDGLLHDSSNYVRKSFDSFTIGDGFLGKCPILVEKKLDEWLTLNDRNVNCKIIRTFKSSGGTKTWPLAKKYIDIFKNSDDIRMRKVLDSTILYLSKRIAGQIT